MENNFTVERLQRWAFQVSRHSVRWDDEKDSPVIGHAVSVALGPWLFIWARFIP